METTCSFVSALWDGLAQPVKMLMTVLMLHARLVEPVWMEMVTTLVTVLLAGLVITVKKWTTVLMLHARMVEPV